MAVSIAAVFWGCVTSQKRLRGRLANSWTSSGVGHLSCQMTRGGDEKRGQQVLSPTSLSLNLSPSLCEKGGRKQRSLCSRAEALPEMGSWLETFSRQEKIDLLQSWCLSKLKSNTASAAKKIKGGALRDGPLEKWCGGGWGEIFNLHEFFFRLLLVQEFFFRWAPLHEFFFRQILLFFEQWNLDSLSIFLCFINYYRSKDTGHFNAKSFQKCTLSRHE